MRSNERVFASCLLPPTPPWVSKDVNIGGPKREPLGLTSIVDGPGFDPDGATNAVPETGVEGGGGEDDLREAGGGGDGGVEVDTAAHAADAVESLAPPLVGGDGKAGDGRGSVDELGEFFVESETRNEVIGSVRDWEFRVAEGVGSGRRVGEVASDGWGLCRGVE